MKLLKKLLLLSTALSLAACSSSKIQNNPTKLDPFGIGDRPMVPKTGALVSGKLKNPGIDTSQLDFSEKIKASREDASNGRKNPNNPIVEKIAKNTIPVRISSSSGAGAQILVWALAPNNWLWGYVGIDASSFNGAADWHVDQLSDGTVAFINDIATGSSGGDTLPTCMDAYVSRQAGLVHTVCGRPITPTQRWQLIPVQPSNGMIIYNAATQTCVQSPNSRNGSAWSIFLTKCDFLLSGDEEFDLSLVWNLTPWPYETTLPDTAPQEN